MMISMIAATVALNSANTALTASSTALRNNAFMMQQRRRREMGEEKGRMSIPRTLPAPIEPIDFDDGDEDTRL